MAMHTVVKIGGSLLRLGTAHVSAVLGRLADAISTVPLLVVPGGAVFDGEVRKASCYHNIGNDAAHWMAVTAMDAYGWWLVDLAPGSVPVRDLTEAQQAVVAGRLPVLLPFALTYGRDALPHTWDVTSDSIAVWVAAAAGARRVILVKDVDGIYTTEPGRGPEPELLSEVDSATASNSGAVDRYFAEALARFFPSGECWVTGGTDPARLADLILGGRPTGTRVILRPASA